MRVAGSQASSVGDVVRTSATQPSDSVYARPLFLAERLPSFTGDAARSAVVARNVGQPGGDAVLRHRQSRPWCTNSGTTPTSPYRSALWFTHAVSRACSHQATTYASPVPSQRSRDPRDTCEFPCSCFAGVSPSAESLIDNGKSNALLRIDVHGRVTCPRRRWSRRFSTSPNNYGEPVRAARSCSTCGSRRAADRYRRNRRLLDERGNFSESARVGRS
jgi:hypothetical protein